MHRGTTETGHVLLDQRRHRVRRARFRGVLLAGRIATVVDRGGGVARSLARGRQRDDGISAKHQPALFAAEPVPNGKLLSPARQHRENESARAVPDVHGTVRATSRIKGSHERVTALDAVKPNSPRVVSQRKTRDLLV
jgi:hypothetical protein